MEQQSQYDQNEPQIIQEGYQTPRKSFLPVYIIAGVVIVAALLAGVFFIFSKGGLNLDKLSTTGFSCPLSRTVLQACSYKIQASDNPEMQIPSEVEALTRGVTCPQTKEQLESCLTGKDNPKKPSTVDLRVKINETGPFDSTQDVNLGDEVTLIWDSTNANFCTLNGRQINATGTQGLYGQLKAGEEVTQEIQCGDATDSITLNVGNYKLPDFKKAENRWFERFSGNTIPTNSYKAYYFDSTKPETILKTETVPKVAISYAWSDGDGFTVRSEDFGGYWIGKIVISEFGTYSVSTAESWSASRVIIDGYEIPSGGEVKIDLEPGTYQVEVEYLNNWHTVDFAMNFEKEVKNYSSKAVQEEIGTLHNNFDVWYVGAYESSNTDRTITVNLDKGASAPVILFLSSYSQVHWKIVNSKGVDVVYVVYGSYEPGTSVTASINSSKLLKLDRGILPTEFTIEANCYDTRSAIFHCENIDGLTKIDEGVQVLTGKKIDGFSGAYSISSVSVPERAITEAVRSEIAKSYKDILQQRSDYEKGQKIENVF